MKILSDKCKRIETVGKSEKTKSCFFEKKIKSDYNNIHVCEHLSHMLLGIR